MKILIAEDEPHLRILLQEKLKKWGYDVVVARDGREAWKTLQSEDAPRLAILDWMMPGIDGIEICRKVRKQIIEPYTYMILLTSQQRESDIVTGMEAGADDYIIKPFKYNELRVRLRAGRRIIELQSELLAAREILKQKASHDSLTGLWNHAEILRILSQEAAKAEREGTCLSVIMADIDFFKKINDTYGHIAGDSVLRLTAERMLSLMRSYDSVGRYGGEEFLIVLPRSDQKNATSLAERLRSHICSEKMDTTDGMIEVTISLGISLTCHGNRRSAKALLKAADEALYQAKEAGRNRVAVAVADSAEFTEDEE